MSSAILFKKVSKEELLMRNKGLISFLKSSLSMYILTGRAKKVDYAPDEEVIRVLARYLSGLILTDDEPFGLRLPEKAIPKGFHLTHVRLSKRNVYTSKPGFTVILSKEKSWRADVKDRTFKKTVSTLLHFAQ